MAKTFFLIEIDRISLGNPAKKAEINFRRSKGWIKISHLCCVVAAFLAATNAVADLPKYKPSSRSSAALDITTNRYGYSQNAPNALRIGDLAPDFSVTTPDLRVVRLSVLAKTGPSVIVFYRGHW